MLSGALYYETVDYIFYYYTSFTKYIVSNTQPLSI